MQWNIFDSEGGDERSVLADVVLSSVFTVLLLLVILLFHINPIGEANKAEEDPPGNLIIEIRWPDGLDVDVDLWCTGPGEPRPVGYSNMSGRVLNLLRDDLGTSRGNKGFRGNDIETEGNTVDALNYENLYSRGLPAGEYSCNVHLFSNRSTKLSIPVDFEASVRKGSGKRAIKRIVKTKAALTERGQEITMIRFELDRNGDLIKESLNSVFIPLRQYRED